MSGEPAPDAPPPAAAAKRVGAGREAGMELTAVIAPAAVALLAVYVFAWPHQSLELYRALAEEAYAGGSGFCGDPAAACADAFGWRLEKAAVLAAALVAASFTLWRVARLLSAGCGPRSPMRTGFGRLTRALAPALIAVAPIFAVAYGAWSAKPDSAAYDDLVHRHAMSGLLTNGAEALLRDEFMPRAIANERQRGLSDAAIDLARLEAAARRDAAREARRLYEATLRQAHPTGGPVDAAALEASNAFYRAEVERIRGAPTLSALAGARDRLATANLIALATGVGLFALFALSGWLQERRLRPRERFLSGPLRAPVWGLVAALWLAFAWAPAPASQLVGAFGVFALFIIALALVAGQLSFWSQRGGGPLLVGVALLALTVAALGLGADRPLRAADAPSERAERQSPRAAEAFVDWLRARPDWDPLCFEGDPPIDLRREDFADDRAYWRALYAAREGADAARAACGAARYPVYVAAAGGAGAEAAAQTLGTLTALSETCPGFVDRLFAISAVSGGAVGAALFAATTADQPRRDDGLGDPCAGRAAAGDARVDGDAARALLEKDLFAPLIGGALFSETIQRALPASLPALERMRAFEAALEASWDAYVERRFQTERNAALARWAAAQGRLVETVSASGAPVDRYEEPPADRAEALRADAEFTTVSGAAAAGRRVQRLLRDADLLMREADDRRRIVIGEDAAAATEDAVVRRVAALRLADPETRTEIFAPEIRAKLAEFDAAVRLSRPENPLAAPYLDHWSPDGARPALLLNAMEVDTGRRRIFSPFVFCAEDDLRFAPLWPSGTRGDASEALNPPLSAVAALGARFAEAAPAGAISETPAARAFLARRACPQRRARDAGDRETRDVPETVRLVDGGYVEGSGAAAAHALIRALNATIEREGLRVDVKLLVLSADGGSAAAARDPLQTSRAAASALAVAAAERDLAPGARDAAYRAAAPPALDAAHRFVADRDAGSVGWRLAPSAALRRLPRRPRYDPTACLGASAEWAAPGAPTAAPIPFEQQRAIDDCLRFWIAEEIRASAGWSAYGAALAEARRRFPRGALR